MWLINTTTYALEEYYANIPKYAILSHRWEEQELRFNEQYTKREPGYKGYYKIEQFIELAKCNGYTHAWADTCCIDKKSSAELSEAINSMYNYYKSAAKCYVYLSDVGTIDEIKDSCWFTRGWTLQELIAPHLVQFFNRDWQSLGFRQDLINELSTITGIPEKALKDFLPEDHCVSEKFSWAAQRSTTREEDQAYALLGIFEVNMPLLYGEGSRAFTRLQEEIMKTSTDTTIFLWQGPGSKNFGVLAKSTSCFSTSNFRAKDYAASFSIDGGWNINNAGITMRACIAPWALDHNLGEIYALTLDPEPRSNSNPIILIEKINTSSPMPAFYRVSLDNATWTMAPLKRLDVPYMFEHVDLRLIRLPLEAAFSSERVASHVLRLRPSQNERMESMDVYVPPAGQPHVELSAWHRASWIGSALHEYSIPVPTIMPTGIHCYVLYKIWPAIQILVCFGLQKHFRPFCIILPFSRMLMDNSLTPIQILTAIEHFESSRSEGKRLYNNLHMAYVYGKDSRWCEAEEYGVRFDMQPGQAETYKYMINIRLRVSAVMRYDWKCESLLSDLTSRGQLRIERELLERRREAFGMMSLP